MFLVGLLFPLSINSVSSKDEEFVEIPVEEYYGPADYGLKPSSSSGAE
ncbi:MAG: hypothetical protein ACR2F1_13445 [Nitrososphaeraceae archaeon]